MSICSCSAIFWKWLFSFSGSKNATTRLDYYNSLCVGLPLKMTQELQLVQNAASWLQLRGIHNTCFAPTTLVINRLLGPTQKLVIATQHSKALGLIKAGITIIKIITLVLWNYTEPCFSTLATLDFQKSPFLAGYGILGVEVHMLKSCQVRKTDLRNVFL